MPNHVSNELKISAAHAEDVKAAILTTYDDGSPRVDFALVVPPPDVPAYRDEPSQAEVSQDPNWWYTWNCKHWGTKWNAYGPVEVMESAIRFDTAWSSPTPVVEELSRRFPEALLTLSYIDEGWCFAGVERWQRGNRLSFTDITCNADVPEFRKLCLRLKGYDPKEDQ